MIDIKAIKAAAEAATPGPWETTCNHPGSVMTKGGKPIATCSMQGGLIDIQANVNHIAISNPTAVIALPDRLKAAEKDAARYRWLAWKSDTNQIMPYDSKNDRFYFGHECDAAIDAAMKEQK